MVRYVGRGISNPLTVIEQLTYLMFIRTLDEKDLESEATEALTDETMPKVFPLMRWSKFKIKDPCEIFDMWAPKLFQY